MKQNTITVLDLATTGFSPQKDVILEVCCLLVDASSLEVLETFATCIRHTEEVLATAPDFHGELIRECANSNVTTRGAEGQLLAGPWSSSKVMVARALDFRMRFLAEHMPTFFRSLKFVLPIDLKALEALALARGVLPYKSELSRSYRAIDDAISAYEELCQYAVALGSTVRK